MNETLKVYQKWEDMELYLHNALLNYPKAVRFTIAAETEKLSMEIGSSIVRANAVRSKSEKIRNIERADVLLTMLKVHIRIGMKMQYVDMKKWVILAGQTAEIGKMLGGWLKSACI
jgi:hypothetical protein